jgi:2-(1,2-epoxy-1,2-dihydrophenyl)acetyl-CoA isomerase
VTYTVDGAVATITMTTPSFGLAAKQMLLAAVTEAAGDDGVRAVVLTGTGRVFTVGQDLREHADALREAGGRSTPSARITTR